MLLKVTRLEVFKSQYKKRRSISLTNLLVDEQKCVTPVTLRVLHTVTGVTYFTLSAGRQVNPKKNCTKSQFRIYLRDVHFPLAFNYYGGLIFLTILAYFQPARWKFGCFYYRSFFTKLSYFSRIILLSYHITTIPSPPATIKTFSCTPHPF